MGAEQLAACGAVEQLDTPCDCVGGIACLDCRGIALVDEHQLTGSVACPYRRRHCIDEGAQCRSLIVLLLMPLVELGKLILEPAYFAQPQEGTPFRRRN